MNKDTIKSRLIAARALIDQPEKWTKDASSCAYGALVAVSQGGEYCWLASHLRRSINSHGGRADGIMGWNDAPERTHAEVMRAFGRAIDDISKANN